MRVGKWGSEIPYAPESPSNDPPELAGFLCTCFGPHVGFICTYFGPHVGLLRGSFTLHIRELLALSLDLRLLFHRRLTATFGR